MLTRINDINDIMMDVWDYYALKNCSRMMRDLRCKYGEKVNYAEMRDFINYVVRSEKLEGLLTNSPLLGTHHVRNDHNCGTEECKNKFTFRLTQVSYQQHQQLLHRKK